MVWVPENRVIIDTGPGGIFGGGRSPSPMGGGTNKQDDDAVALPAKVGWRLRAVPHTISA
jgi:hypothetical protein